jgi:broad-specificity NMP kinase
MTNKTIWIGDPFDACPKIADDQLQDFIDKAFDILTKDKKPSDTPHFIITAGTAGAGKTTLSKLLVKYKSTIPESEYVIYDVDLLANLFVDWYPKGVVDIEGNPTQLKSAYAWSQCTERIQVIAPYLLGKLTDNKYNIILQSHEHIVLPRIKNAGYITTLLYVIASEHVALSRAIKRAYSLGQFLYPANKDNDWGWKNLVHNKTNFYRTLVPWFALWADNFGYVVNNVDGQYPKEDDFKMFDIANTKNSVKEIRENIEKIINDIFKSFEEDEKKSEDDEK